MSDEVSLPPLPSSGASLEEAVEALRRLILWAAAREPLADGTTLDKFLTARAAIGANLLSYSPGLTGSASGDALVPGAGTSNPADASQPTPISGLAVAQGVSSYLVTIDAPNYVQGGGNGRTIIYKANYSGSGPLPTFSDAVEAGTIPGKGALLLLTGEPGVEARFWAKAETRHPTLQALPSGGTNGVGATADLIENQHIGSLSVAKLLAGSIGVSEYIQSTGYTGSGVSEWRIGGDGIARFSGVIVSGTLQSGTAAVSGTTMTGTGAVFNPSGSGSGAWGNSTTNLTFNGTTMTMNGAWVATANLEANAATEITEVSVSSLSVTGASGAGTNYLSTSRWTPVGTVSFTAAFTGNVLLLISAGAAFSGAPGIGVGELWCALTLSADFNDDDTVDAGDTLIEDFVIVPQTGTGPVRTAYLAAHIPRAVTQGVAYTWNIYAQKLEGTCTISNFYARVEQIKR